MKAIILPLALVLFAPGILFADTVTAFRFENRSLELPPTSLREQVATGTRDFDATTAKLCPPARHRPVPLDRKQIAPRSDTSPPAMPVIPPDPRYDYTMRIQTPDDTMDYKMLIKRVGPPSPPLHRARPPER